MGWVFAVPLIFSGLFLYSACTSPAGSGIIHSGAKAVGLTMAAIGGLVVLS